MANDTHHLHECNRIARDTPGLITKITQFASKIGSAGPKKTAPAVATNNWHPGPNHY